MHARAGTVVLLSAALDGLARAAGEPERAVFLTTAANDLPDRDAVLGPPREALGALGAVVTELDLEDRPDLEALEDADLLLVGGGDPFRLLAAARAGGLGAAVARLGERGGAYVGLSAGAMVAAPSLVPLRGVSPFEPARDQDLTGLGNAPLLVLPHDDREGRRHRHEAALRHHGRDVEMLAIADGEQVVIGERWRLEAVDGTYAVRLAEPPDAAAIGEVHVAAGRQEWSPFLGESRLSQMVSPAADWRDRIAGSATGDLLVAEDGAGLCGFVWCRRPGVDALDATLGEVAAFYTHPRVWGRGIGRRLMDTALDRLRQAGASEAILWTEERNARPRRFYERNGWRLDGTSRERDFLGAPLHELLHRREL